MNAAESAGPDKVVVFHEYGYGCYSGKTYADVFVSISGGRYKCDFGSSPVCIGRTLAETVLKYDISGSDVPAYAATGKEHLVYVITRKELERMRRLR